MNQFLQTMCPGVVKTELFSTHDYAKDEKMQEVIDKYVKLEPSNIGDGVWFMIDQPKEVNVRTIQMFPKMCNLSIYL